MALESNRIESSIHTPITWFAELNIPQSAHVCISVITELRTLYNRTRLFAQRWVGTLTYPSQVRILCAFSLLFFIYLLYLFLTYIQSLCFLATVEKSSFYQDLYFQRFSIHLGQCINSFSWNGYVRLKEKCNGENRYNCFAFADLGTSENNLCLLRFVHSLSPFYSLPCFSPVTPFLLTSIYIYIQMCASISMYLHTFPLLFDNKKMNFVLIIATFLFHLMILKLLEESTK